MELLHKIPESLVANYERDDRDSRNGSWANRSSDEIAETRVNDGAIRNLQNRPSYDGHEMQSEK